MFPQAFYQTMAQLCFTLLGLWWLVLQTKYREWIGSPPQRRRITNISFYFLLPGSMSLLALLATNTRTLWQIAFCVAGILGVIETIAIIRGAPKKPNSLGQRGSASGRRPRLWPVQVAQWLALLLYALIAVVAVIPDTSYLQALGMAPLTVEGVLATLVVLLGLLFAWVYFLEPEHIDAAGDNA